MLTSKISLSLRELLHYLERRISPISEETDLYNLVLQIRIIECRKRLIDSFRLEYVPNDPMVSVPSKINLHWARPQKSSRNALQFPSQQYQFVVQLWVGACRCPCFAAYDERLMDGIHSAMRERSTCFLLAFCLLSMVALPSTISIPSALGALLLGLCSWGVPHWVDLPVEGPPMGFGVHVVGKEPWCIDLTMQSCLLLEARLQSVCRSLLRDEKKMSYLGS